MRAGKVVEAGPASAIFEAPRHDYTKALFEAAFRTHAIESDRVGQQAAAQGCSGEAPPGAAAKV